MFTCAANANELQPLEKMYGNNNKRLEDTVEIEYVFHRCTALYYLVVQEYLPHSKGSDQYSLDNAEIAKKSQLWATKFTEWSQKAAMRTNRSSNSLKERVITLNKKYQKIYDRNRELHNDGTFGIVKSDLTFCNLVGTESIKAERRTLAK